MSNEQDTRDATQGNCQPDTKFTDEEGEMADAAPPQDVAVGSATASQEEYKDRYLRAAADLDNYRKRVARDITFARKHVREAILRDFATVLDNFDRALDSAHAENSHWIEGINAIRAQMLDVMRKHGAKPFDSVGEMFDPKKHEAVATVNLPDKPEGTIADVVEIGYEMEEGVILRPARVIVVSHS